MFSVSKITRSKCAEVLDHAVSHCKNGFLSSNGDLASLQILSDTFSSHIYFACFYQRSVVYISALSFFTTSLFTDGNYRSLSAGHFYDYYSYLDYGLQSDCILVCIPGQNAYLIGFSIIGGMAYLFHLP